MRARLALLAASAILAFPHLAAAQTPHGPDGPLPPGVKAVAGTAQTAPGLSAEERGRVEALIRDLGDDSFPKREAASAALRKLGSGAAPLLREALKSDDAEVRWRAQNVLNNLTGAPGPETGGLEMTVRPVRENFAADEALALEVVIRNVTARGGGKGKDILLPATAMFLGWDGEFVGPRGPRIVRWPAGDLLRIKPGGEYRLCVRLDEPDAPAPAAASHRVQLVAGEAAVDGSLPAVTEDGRFQGRLRSGGVAFTVDKAPLLGDGDLDRAAATPIAMSAGEDEKTEREAAAKLLAVPAEAAPRLVKALRHKDEAVAARAAALLAGGKFGDHDAALREALPGIGSRGRLLFLLKVIQPDNIPLSKKGPPWHPGMTDERFGSLAGDVLRSAPWDLETIVPVLSFIEDAGASKVALEWYRHAFAYFPDHPGVLNNYAWLLCTAKDASIRDPKAALPMSMKACAAEPGNASSLDTLAMCHHLLGEHDKAVEESDRALALLGPPPADGGRGTASTESWDELRKNNRMFRAAQAAARAKEKDGDKPEGEK
jgi:tetratricopeptide (TPR) repeat protein